MHRIHIGVMCLLMVLILGVSLEATGQDADAGEQKIQDMSVPMGVIVLKPDESVEQQKSAVEFNHPQHFIYDCKTCHHKWEGSAKVANCTTSKCHDLLKAPKKPTKYLAYTEKGIKYYKYAYHQTCIGCHKEIKVEQEKMEMLNKATEKKKKIVPTSCTECHPKE